MRVVDARSGKDIAVGQTLDRGDGESVTLLQVIPGLLTAKLYMMSRWRHPSGKIVGEDVWGEVPVRYMHPAFMFQRVAFLPS